MMNNKGEAVERMLMAGCIKNKTVVRFKLRQVSNVKLQWWVDNKARGEAKRCANGRKKFDGQRKSQIEGGTMWWNGPLNKDFIVDWETPTMTANEVHLAVS